MLHVVFIVNAVTYYEVTVFCFFYVIAPCMDGDVPCCCCLKVWCDLMGMCGHCKEVGDWIIFKHLFILIYFMGS